MTVAARIFVKVILVIILGFDEVFQCGFFNCNWSMKVFLIGKNLVDDFRVGI